MSRGSSSIKTSYSSAQRSRASGTRLRVLTSKPRPGAYELSIRAVMRGGRATRTLKKVEVGAATFKTGDIDVPENFVTPDEASKKRIAAEQAVKERAYAHFIATPQWSGDFVKP